MESKDKNNDELAIQPENSEKKESNIINLQNIIASRGELMLEKHYLDFLLGLGKTISHFRLQVEPELSQEELARITGISQETINDIENGKDGVKIIDYLKVSDVICKSLTFLIRKTLVPGGKKEHRKILEDTLDLCDSLLDDDD